MFSTLKNGQKRDLISNISFYKLKILQNKKNWETNKCELYAIILNTMVWNITSILVQSA